MDKQISFKNDALDVLKSVLIATLFSLAFILIFALVIKFASLPAKVIMPVNIAIKLISIALGVLIGTKQARGGLLKGAVSGLVYMLLTFFIFAALSGFKDINFSWIDLITLPIAGAIVGVIAVNIRSKRSS